MSERVLLAIESLTVRMDALEALEEAGIDAVACATPEEARTALAAAPVHALVIDPEFGGGRGAEVLLEARRGTDAPAVLLCARAACPPAITEAVRQESVFLPIYEPTALLRRVEELLAAHRLRTAPRLGPTILLVGTDPSLLGPLEEVLAERGYGVATATDAESADRLGAQVRPDLAVVDAGSPGLDPGGVVRAVRLESRLRRMPCLLLTGSDAGSGEVAALDVDADAHVARTADRADVVARLEELLRAILDPGGEDAGFGRRRLLAVDDSATFLDAMAEVLRDDGYDVVLARSGEEALGALSRHRVDCILLDLVMPGLSGDETCRRIKANPTWARIPVVMLTAHDDRTATVASIDAGADDYVAKSSDFEVLRARVRAQLRRIQFEDENRRIRERLAKERLVAIEARAARRLADARAELLQRLRATNHELARKNRELEAVNAELDAFGHTVSHDLRAPLRAIHGFSSILALRHGEELGPEASELLENVRAAAHRMEALITDLLELAQLGRAELRIEDVDVTAIVREVARELEAAEPDREVALVVEEGLVVRGDPRLLRIALQNLVGNAWKFTRHRPDARIEVGAVASDGERRLYVRDNGVGFDAHRAGRIFEPFRRLHGQEIFEGTGIGLATVQRILKRHGGEIWAESSPGRGATFTFTLPAADAAVPG